jgi:hypothetical protein
MLAPADFRQTIAAPSQVPAILFFDFISVICY